MQPTLRLGILKGEKPLSAYGIAAASAESCENPSLEPRHAEVREQVIHPFQQRRHRFRRQSRKANDNAHPRNVELVFLEARRRLFRHPRKRLRTGHARLDRQSRDSVSEVDCGQRADVFGDRYRVANIAPHDGFAIARLLEFPRRPQPARYQGFGKGLDDFIAQSHRTLAIRTGADVQKFLEFCHRHGVIPRRRRRLLSSALP